MQKPLHPRTVEGFQSVEELAEIVLRMRYDEVEKFFAACAKELWRQADGDQGRGRLRLATLLRESAGRAEELKMLIGQAWQISAPHMEE